MRGPEDWRREEVTVRFLLWLTLVLLLPVVPGQAGDTPTGCEPLDVDSFSCRWSLDGPNTSVAPPDAWVIPVFERTLVTLTVTLTSAPDAGWSTLIQRHAAADAEGVWTTVDEAHHAPSSQPAIRSSVTTTHVLAAQRGDSWQIVFRPGEAKTPLLPDAGVVYGSAPGHYEVAYYAERVPEGVVPARPAATQEEPQVRDAPADVAEPSWDILAAWWDDSRLDDGLFDVHLQVTSLDIRDAAFRAPSASGVADSQAQQLMWKAVWTVDARSYHVEWSVQRSARDVFSCVLSTEMINEADEVVLAHPLCEADIANGTLHATIPEAAAGAPEDGTRFESLAARSRVRISLGFTDVLDETQPARFVFALGGPGVWDGLNGCRFCTPAPAWYEQPLAPENADRTLQVVGTVAALATFLIGALLVWRRRRQTHRLLARIEAVAADGIDASSTLLVLGRLEEEFSLMFRKHKITDGQYQILTQRIAGVATRFALRRTLGLDDGVPGEATPMRRVPVADGKDVRKRN